MTDERLWRYDHGWSCDEWADHIYQRGDGLWAHIHTKRHKNGDWGRGKIQYSWSRDFKRTLKKEPKLKKGALNGDNK